MTPQEFADKMREFRDESHGDPEAAHGHADRLMCEVLRHLGYGDGADVFESEEFDMWYA